MGVSSRGTAGAVDDATRAKTRMRSEVAKARIADKELWVGVLPVALYGKAAAACPTILSRALNWADIESGN